MNKVYEKKLTFKRHSVVGVMTILVLVTVCFGTLKWKFNTPTVVNPFTPKLTVSTQFPLYYPTNLPAGYRVDPKSVTVPQQGVVLFNLVGPKKTKIYISEEARPPTFNLGGFYGTFSGLEEVPVSDGAIAVGHINNGQTVIGSRANDKTWILSNTTANISLNQLTDMLKSLTPSY